jgi:hypothetical protein
MGFCVHIYTVLYHIFSCGRLGQIRRLTVSEVMLENTTRESYDQTSFVHL